jgi:hypothetical protein
MPPEFLLAFSLGRRACIVGLVAVAFWLVAELGCGAETQNMHRGKPGAPTPGRFLAWMHVVWHVLIGYTSYLLLALAQWLQGVSLSRYEIQISPWFTMGGRCHGTRKRATEREKETRLDTIRASSLPIAERMEYAAKHGKKVVVEGSGDHVLDYR